jgi:hypothetical protein
VACEDPAVAAKAREQRTSYIAGGLGCLALGGVIVWSLSALNNQAGRRARQDAATQYNLTNDWDFHGPAPN